MCRLFNEGLSMELAAIAAQQAMFQQQMTLSMFKSSVESQQAVADMVAETVNATGRGQIVNLQV
jgi:hypothetical protein